MTDYIVKVYTTRVIEAMDEVDALSQALPTNLKLMGFEAKIVGVRK